VSRITDWLTDSMFGMILLILGAAALVGLLIGALVVPINYVWSAHTCDQRADQMGLQHDYGFWTECMVRLNDDDPWVPLDGVRVQAGQLYTDEEGS
jgi:hypothetical protein